VSESFPEAKSLIVVAVPQPICELTFVWEGKRIRAVVPPTYANAVDVDTEIVDLLEKGDGNGVHLMRAILPHKTLAARSGLVEYGQNNITYVPGFGSFHRLTSFFTNRELPDDWQERKVMERCAECGACQKACPTQAIAEDHFLLHAERCITYHNEMPAEIPFPNYISEGMHNAVVGCMICQRVCPANAKVKDWMVHCPELNEDETQFLIRGDFSGPRGKVMAARLELLGLELSMFPRNLKALFDRV
jgi:epoxyqueuosine reductase